MWKRENKKAGQLAGFLVAACQITSWQRQQQERQQEQQRQQQERLGQQRQQQERQQEQQRQQQERLEQQEPQQQEQQQELQQELLLSGHKQTGTGPTGRRAGRNVSFIFPFNKVITKKATKKSVKQSVSKMFQYRPTGEF
jgi:hypothetical protein